LICNYLTPDRPTVNDDTHGQSPTLYRAIINLSLTAHCLNRISSTHIATNMSLTEACKRWDLFLHTVTTNPAYASHVKYLKFSESTSDVHAIKHKEDDGVSLLKMLKALTGLEVLYSHRGVKYTPAMILQCLTSESLPLWKTLQTVRFDHVNAWQEDEIVQINLVRQILVRKGTLESYTTTGTHLLTGDLDDLGVSDLCDKIPEVVDVQVVTKDLQDDEADEDADADWADEDEDEDEEDGESDWSEQDYEDDSEDSDWDSEDESDYEDDWEAEYGFSLPKVEPVKEATAAPAAPVVGVPARGTSLLDF